MQSFDEHEPEDCVEVETPEPKMSPHHKKRIITILFRRLLTLHQRVMQVFTFVHFLIILFACIRIIKSGSIESETKGCYFAWPLSHLTYAFVNYLFAWFSCYNCCEVHYTKGSELIRKGKRFLQIMLLFSLLPFGMKLFIDSMCRNWELPWRSVFFDFLHIATESLLLRVYFLWFEKKFSGFKIIYKELVF